VIASLLTKEAATHERPRVVQSDAIIKVLDHHRAELERSAVRLPSRVDTWKELALWARTALLDETAANPLAA